MEKDSRSGQPNHISPQESLSGSKPENTVTEAREQVATFRVSTSRGATVSPLPPNSRETSSRYPVWENTPRANTSSTSPATLASRVVATTRRKLAIKNHRSFTNQGARPKNRYHTIKMRGSSLAMTVSSLP